MTLTVLSFNLKGLKLDADAVGQILITEAADVVSIQEPPAHIFRRKFRSWAASYGYTLIQPTGLRNNAKTTALLVSYRAAQRVTASGSEKLSFNPLDHKHRKAWPVRRGTCWLEIDGLRVFAVHLGLVEKERRRHLIELYRMSARTPTVLVGDFNDPPATGVRRELPPQLTDIGEDLPSTFPAISPRVAIDTALITSQVECLSASVISNDRSRVASDHLPVRFQFQTR